MYDPALGRWHTFDPKAEMFSGLSPYNLCFNNPTIYIDPNGMVVDDYFNKDGKYLGSDDAKSDNIKIIEQKDWDDNKETNSNGEESIDHETGNALSTDHSKSEISEDASLTVYEHYNTTGNSLVAADSSEEDGDGGMIFSGNSDGTTKIKIKLLGNRRHKVADHANEIKSLYDHEGVHAKDFKTVGFVHYKYNLSENEKEGRAIQFQKKQPSWGKTSLTFRRSMINQGSDNGLLTPLKKRTINNIN